MRRTTLVCAISSFGMSLMLGASAFAAPGGDKGPAPGKGQGHNNIKVHLKGFEEVPVVVTGAAGNLELDIDEAGGTIDYELTYDGLEGTVTQSHIHIGQRNVNGGITLWLCQTAGTQAPVGFVRDNTPICPAPGGTVSGTLVPASVLGIATQGVPAGSFTDVLTAIRSGKAYANVHTSTSPGGEIRGQLTH